MPSQNTQAPLRMAPKIFVPPLKKILRTPLVKFASYAWIALLAMHC